MPAKARTAPPQDLRSLSGQPQADRNEEGHQQRILPLADGDHKGLEHQQARREQVDVEKVFERKPDRQLPGQQPQQHKVDQHAQQHGRPIRKPREWDAQKGVEGRANETVAVSVEERLALRPNLVHHGIKNVGVVELRDPSGGGQLPGEVELHEVGGICPP
jgi:hypothetical protein